MGSEPRFLFLEILDQYGVSYGRLRRALDPVSMDLDANPELLEAIIIWIACRNVARRRRRPPLNFLEELRNLHAKLTRE